MRKFNKIAMSPYFKWKVDIAEKMLIKFDVFKTTRNTPYETIKTVFDKERNIYLSVYIGKKVNGFGKGRIIDVNINFDYEKHPEHKFRALGKLDLKTYSKQFNVTNPIP